MTRAQRLLLALAAGWLLAGPVHAANGDASNASLAMSTLPVASVVLSASAASTVVAAVPAALSGAGTLVVRGVEASARGTVYVLERVADGSRASVEVSGRMASDASAALGKTVTVSTFAAGTLLSVAGEVLAFIPNELGKALLHNEQVSR